MNIDNVSDCEILLLTFLNYLSGDRTITKEQIEKDCREMLTRLRSEYTPEEPKLSDEIAAMDELDAIAGIRELENP